MVNLLISKKELMNFFPLKIDNLKLITPVYSEFELKLIFLYQETKKECLSSDYSEIHDELKLYLRRGLIQKFDLPILYFHIRNKYDKNSNIIHSLYIWRNRNLKDFSGVGIRFYNSFKEYLSNEGVQYIFSIPEDKRTEQFWINQGKVPIDSLKFEHKIDLFQRVGNAPYLVDILSK